MTAQREWFDKDYYKVLGVTDKAQEKEITSAYRKLAKKYHPDANPGPQAEERFKEVSAAYDVLGDASKRREYDEVRHMRPAGTPFAGQGNGGASGSFKVDDLSDLLGGLFSRGRARTRQGPQRGDDLETTLNLSFVDAVEGVVTSVNITSDAACNRCGGTGAAPGTTSVVCSACGGRGMREENQGLFSFSQTCRDCGGVGMRVETPCPVCAGSGLERRPRQVKVRVPAGVEDGRRIVLKGRGGAGHNGGPSGDVYVVVRVGPHELFGRKGKDLTLTVPITFAEATLGTTVRIPTLAEPVTLRIPPGTRSGRTFRVRGRGSRAGDGAGDLLATIEVVVPDTLTDAQREAVEALAAASSESPRRHLGVE